jgi:hypothetical protein
MWKPTRLLHGEGRRLWRQEGTTPHDATRSRGSTGVMAVACLHREIRRNTGSLGGEGRVTPQPTTREGQVGPSEVAERLV